MIGGEQASWEVYRNPGVEPMLAPGSKLLRKNKVPTFMIGYRLGLGGFAEVNAGLDLANNDMVAIKQAPHIQDDQALLQKEADLLAKISSHYLVPRYVDFVEENDQTDYLAMELIEGPQFSSILKTCQSEKYSRPIGEIIMYLATIAFGLTEIAQIYNCLHGDLSPENQMGYPKTPKVIDFGISPKIYNVISPSQFVGNPQYMAPEVFNTRKNYSTQSDVHTLAVILHEALTGEWVFGTYPECVNKKLEIQLTAIAVDCTKPHTLRDDAPAIADLPTTAINELELIQQKGLNKGKNKRYADTSVYGYALLNWLKTHQELSEIKISYTHNN